MRNLGHLGVVKIGIEQIFDCTIEMICEFECEFQRGIVSVTFDGVNRLTRDANGLREACLALVTYLPFLADSRIHRYR